MFGGDGLGRVIFVTSFKGGVGKTTVTAGLAVTLARMGKRVMLIDGDFGMRCMDMVLGLQNESIYNICDVLCGACNIEDAVLRHESGVDFVAAPMSGYDKSITKEAFFWLFDRLKKNYDFVFVDSSAEKSDYYLQFAAVCEEAIIVAMHRSTAVRAAEKTALTLANVGFSNLRLVVNCYDSERAENGILPSLYDIINRSSVRLIGVVPLDFSVIEWQEEGISMLESDEKYMTPSEKAFVNIAIRLMGGTKPLLDDVYKKTRRKKFIL